MERLRVFISSTQNDLQPERDAVEALVENLGHECVRAETYDSPGASPEQVCRQMARECDIYIGIFGGRYGFKPPHLDVSATQLEYREARVCNPQKVFVYVKNTGVADSQQEEFLREVQDFAAGYFRHERFADCQELVEQVRRDIVTWTTRRIREALLIELKVKALLDKVAYLARVMDWYGVPEDLR